MSENSWTFVQWVNRKWHQNHWVSTRVNYKHFYQCISKSILAFSLTLHRTLHCICMCVKMYAPWGIGQCTVEHILHHRTCKVQNMLHAPNMSSLWTLRIVSSCDHQMEQKPLTALTFERKSLKYSVSHLEIHKIVRNIFDLP